MIELSLKNSFYNRNRLQEEWNRMNAGFESYTNEQNLEICKIFNVKPTQTLEIGVPVTIKADIFTFEFTSFMTNIIRSCNFALAFKMRVFDNYSSKISPTIGRYCTGKMNSKIKSRNQVHDLILQNYEDWIEKANELRNTVVHEYVQYHLPGYMVMRRTRVSEEEATYEAFMELSLEEHGIDDPIAYCNQTLERAVAMHGSFLKVALSSVDNDASP